MIRLFAGLPIPPETTDRLAMLQQSLPGRPVDPADFHLTLAFFGETSEPVAADLDAALGAIRRPGFAFWLDGVGAFGGDRPRAIYAAVRPEPALTLLHDKVAQAGRLAGLRIDAGRWTPHVTLTRLKPGSATADRAARALAGRAMFLAGPVAVSAFHLYRSEPGRSGARYTVLSRYALG